MYPVDLALYKHFDDKGREISGYERAGDVYQDYGRGRPLFGHSPDFGYWYYGSIWYGDELWNGGRVGDYDGDGTDDASDAFPKDPEEWTDTDGDGVGDNRDAYPDDRTRWQKEEDDPYEGRIPGDACAIGGMLLAVAVPFGLLLWFHYSEKRKARPKG